MRLIFLCVSIFFSALSSAQTIISIAGNGTMLNTGDGGPATSAGIYYPTYGAFDKFGNYYLATGDGYTVRKINPSGIITTIAGSGGSGDTGDGGLATNAKFNNPQGVAVDSAGNLYISDAQNNRIRKVDVVTNIVTTVVGTGVASYTGDGGPATSASIADPLGLRFDHFGNLYIADYVNAVVRKVDTAGIISTVAGNGIPGYSGDGLAATNANIIAWDVCVDDTGNIYVADGARSVRKVNTSGIISTIVGNGISGFTGGNGVPATSVETTPYCICMDKNGNIYISDYDNNVIQMVNSAGLIYTVVGTGAAGFFGDGGPATTAELNHPGGICFDSCGNLYIPDSRTYHVRKVLYDSFCTASLSLNNLIASGEISIYPSPAYDQLTITSANAIHEVTIDNMIGQQVSDQVYDAEKAEVNVSGLPPGVYVVRVTNGDGNVIVTKVLKE